MDIVEVRKTVREAEEQIEDILSITDWDEHFNRVELDCGTKDTLLRQAVETVIQERHPEVDVVWLDD